MTQREAFESEAGLLAALEELQSLSRPPMPKMANWPPWDRIRAALPPDCELPTMPVNVLVDLELDSTGLVTYAAVGHPPQSLRRGRAVSVSVGPDGRPVIEPPVAEAPAALAEAVAAAHIGERFSPGERGGVPVAVRLLRVGVGIAPGTL
jgi:hypothetical protein